MTDEDAVWQIDSWMLEKDKVEHTITQDAR
jgi:hypothetical protein